MRLPGARVRVVLALLVILLQVLFLYRLSGLDLRFVPQSWSSVGGLARYLVGDYRGAALAYRAHLKAVAVAQREHIDPVWAAVLEGRWADAESGAEAQLAREWSADALLTLGEVALARNEPKRALETVRRVLQADPEEYDAWLLSAVAHARLRDYPAAVHSMTRALRLDRVERRPTTFLAVMENIGDLAARPDHEGQCLLAHYHRYLRIFDRSEGAMAIRLAHRAIAANDEADAAWVTIGVVLMKQEGRDRALEAFQEAVRVNPRNAEAFRWLAHVYSDRGDLLNELRFMKAAFDAAPGDGYYATELHFVLTQKLGDYRQALDLYRAGLAARPTDAELWGKLGEVQFQLGNFAEALDAHTRAAALAPNNPDHLVHQSRALMAADQNERALAVLQRALALRPEASEPYYMLGTAYYRLRRYPDATAAIERSFSIDPPANAERLVVLCGLYRRALAFEQTYTCLQAALRMDPRNQQALRWMRDAEQNVASGRRAGR
jgi:superkiller protein 3